MASLALRPLRAAVRPRVAAAYSTAAAPTLRKGTKLLVCDMAGTTVEENGLVYTTLRESMCRAGLSVSEAEMHPWHGAAKEEVVRHFARREAAPGDVKGAAELEKLDLAVADRNDVVAVPEDAVRYALTGRVSLAKRGDGFSLGDRAGVLKRMDEPPLLVHVAIKENRRYPFEELFRSSLRHLADAALSETHFVTAFLHGADQSSPAVQSTLQAIFRRAFSATLEHLENKLFACHDAVGLLLVVRLIERARTRATRGPAPTASALDAFLGDCEALVRPRLLTILTQNLEGVKKAELSRLGVVSTAPHYVARRYGELHATVLALFPDECRAAAARDADVASPPASPAASPASPALRKIVEFASRRSSVSSTASAPTNGAASAAAQAASLMEELRERTAELLLPVWKSTSVSGAPDNSSPSHFTAMTRPCWLRRVVMNRHRHAIEQASRRWRGEGAVN